MRKNSQPGINIIYPEELGAASPEALILCEVVINGLIKEKFKEFYCKVNTDLGYVECEMTEIKNTLLLLLKTNKIKYFYEQFNRLLHKSEDGANSNFLGRLKLANENFLFDIVIIEEDSFPNFKWKIVKTEIDLKHK